MCIYVYIYIYICTKKKIDVEKWSECNNKAWIEIEEKKVAKIVAKKLNGTKMQAKYVNHGMKEDYIWKIHYLKGFKWHHLLEHQQNLSIVEHRQLNNCVAMEHSTSTHNISLRDPMIICRPPTPKFHLSSFQKCEKRRREEDLQLQCTLMVPHDNFVSGTFDKDMHYQWSPPLKRPRLIQQSQFQLANI
ncbi:basal transcriptional activator [Reticulomyxa filosa]|uniref:Basal transcriptional activator n=1 Tax=Reticulomyxa filosa TaxID=46433 RepID=X6MXV9_RETFI|nr:basal transcriptional activator [Reticulomyxa filosa]|eukprot:ETO17890.1 basal transcriptional activator [Reticulomyxa filosa]